MSAPAFSAPLAEIMNLPAVRIAAKILGRIVDAGSTRARVAGVPDISRETVQQAGTVAAMPKVLHRVGATVASSVTTAKVGGASDAHVCAAAVGRLAALGFDANVRTLRLDAELEVSMVAVYVLQGDRRVHWAHGSPPAPVGFRYRVGERSALGVTLFSGHSEAAVTEFADAISAPALRNLLWDRPATGNWTPEWDPHSMTARDAKHVESHMLKAIELSFPESSTPHLRRTGERRRSVAA